MWLAHLSDLHLLSLRGVGFGAFLNKRITGAANLALGRAHTHQVDVVRCALDAIAERDVDHVVVTGDLTNLSLDSEFELARSLLDSLPAGIEVSVIPGNHDVYTYGAARRRRFEACFGDFMETDLPALRADGTYPWVKLRPGVALIGLSSAVPTLPLVATGRVSRGQLAQLERILRRPELSERVVVALVHHPLLPGRQPLPVRWSRRLVNARALRRVLLAGGVDLVLHGHEHRPHWDRLERPDGGTLHVIEAGSSSANGARNPHHAGRFNLYEVVGGRLHGLVHHRYRRPDREGEAGAFEAEPAQRFAPDETGAPRC